MSRHAKPPMVVAVVRSAVGAGERLRRRPERETDRMETVDAGEEERDWNGRAATGCTGGGVLSQIWSA